MRDHSSFNSLDWKSCIRDNRIANSWEAEKVRRFWRLVSKPNCKIVAAITLSFVECEKRCGKAFCSGVFSNQPSSEKKAERPLFLITSVMSSKVDSCWLTLFQRKDCLKIYNNIYRVVMVVGCCKSLDATFIRRQLFWMSRFFMPSHHVFCKHFSCNKTFCSHASFLVRPEKTLAQSVWSFEKLFGKKKNRHKIDH